jgi:hypothetical protein
MDIESDSISTAAGVIEEKGVSQPRATSTDTLVLALLLCCSTGLFDGSLMAPYKFSSYHHLNSDMVFTLNILASFSIGAGIFAPFLICTLYLLAQGSIQQRQQFTAQLLSYLAPGLCLGIL